MLLQSQVTNENRKLSIELCETYLGPKWKNLSEEDFLIEIIKGGVCNQLFLCTNKRLERTKKDDQVPFKVIVRIYGHPFVGERGDMISINVYAIPFLCGKLELLNMGPKIYGIFDKGRLEEYISHKMIEKGLRNDKNILKIISQKMALIHSLDMPISKNPNAIFDLIIKFINEGQATFETRLSQLETVTLEEAKFLFNLITKKEVEWVKNNAPKFKSPIVFCHNDLKFGNIGLREDKKDLKDQVFIFDYENCSYGYRGYDLAFFLHSINFDFRDEKFWESLNFPSHEVINEVIDDYLEEWKKLSPKLNQDIDNRDNVLIEVEYFTIVIYLLYYAVFFKKIQKGFLEKAIPFVVKLKETYSTAKEEILKKYSVILQT